MSKALHFLSDDQIDHEEVSLRNRLQELASVRAYRAQLTPTQQLAIKLYEILGYRFDRDSAWGYELHEGKHNWSRAMHSEWLRKAEHFATECKVSGLSQRTVLTLLEILLK